MKRLCTSLLALTLLLGATSAIHPAKNTWDQRSTRDQLYYWYDMNDNFVDRASVATEEIELETKYGVLVDQNPTGGTLLEEGYVAAGKPHTDLPGGMLYGHF